MEYHFPILTFPLQSTMMYVQNKSYFDLTKDTTYHALMGELWAIYYE